MKKYCFVFMFALLSALPAKDIEMNITDIRAHAGFVPIGNGVTVNAKDGKYLILNDQNKEISNFKVINDEEKLISLKKGIVVDAGAATSVDLILIAKPKYFLVVSGAKILRYALPK